MGNVIDIVAEYNPFHNGHTRLIEQTRARLGADCPVVCVMSGYKTVKKISEIHKNFNKMWRKRKQFGNAVAILRKSCYNGPDPLRSSCAERFSRG